MTADESTMTPGVQADQPSADAIDESTKATPTKQPSAAITVSDEPTVRYDVSLLTKDDLYLFNEGSHFHLYEKLGAHPMIVGGVEGVYFAVWAPNADRVAVMGDFNNWNRESHDLRARDLSGVWEGFIPKLSKGAVYKYYIHSRYHGYRVEKSDPFANYFEVPPKSASVVWDQDYVWNDSHWLQTRGQRNQLNAPISIYEVHLGSWMRNPEDNHCWLSYRELAPLLADYVNRTGFTHIELLPVMEHPFFGSWGYQSLGYFAPSSRFGTPQDFMYLVDYLHQHDIGVILDWVPSHFPTDQHGLGYFDGTHLYEHADPRKGFHPDWGSFIFNYGRDEVRSFLMSSAFYWLDRFHIDGLRVDAVASMLYLNYSRKEGEWIPNEYGGNENLEAIYFLRRFNEEIYKKYPDVQTFAEESTAWPMVSRPVYLGGLGFGLKWDMGWMHDTLMYAHRDPIHRHYHHNEMTFRMLYAFNENFVLPISHDEVVHGKGALLDKMPGSVEDRFANLRAVLSYMFAQPAKKLLFMGCEFGQWREWNHDESLDWHLLEFPSHQGVQRLVGDLNRLYRSEPALHELDCEPDGFMWIDANDADNSSYSFIRMGRSTNDIILAVFNFTPMLRRNHRIGVPRCGYWREILNSDAHEYWGFGYGNMGGVDASPLPSHDRPCSINITLPPLGAVFFKNEG